jgi:hypothetical protein
MDNNIDATSGENQYYWVGTYGGEETTNAC